MFKYLIAGAAVAYVVYQTFFANSQDDRPPSPPYRPPYRPSSPPYRPSSPPYRPPSPPYRPPSPPYRPPSPPYPPSSPPYRPPLEFVQPSVRRRDERQSQQSIVSAQRERTPTKRHVSLRARAKRESDLKNQCSQQSQAAYQRGDHARAKALSEEAKRHALRVDDLNARACAIIYKENNQNQGARDIDLHRLHVKEAIAFSERAIIEARRRGDSEIHLIVGQGTHSDGGISRLKPAIQDDMRTRGIPVEVHPKNPGVLIVQLSSR